MKKFLRCAALILAVVFCLASAAACGSGNKGTKGNDAGQTASRPPDGAEPGPSANETSDVNYYPWNDDPSQDSSDLPTWTGKQLKLTYWWGHGTGGDAKKYSSDDVTSPEIARVTGVSFDMDNSFDNGGQNYDVKLAVLAATNDWPDLVFVMQNEDLYKFENSEGRKRYDPEKSKIWDLTEYIPKYCPNLQFLYDNRLIQNPADSFDWETLMKEIDLDTDPKTIDYQKYADPQPDLTLPYSVYKEYYNKRPNLNPDVDLVKYTVFDRPGENLMRVKVRDDVVKALYSGAKTQREIEDLYARQGYFTVEDILDVPINSNADFYAFCRAVKALGLEEDGKPVYALNAYSGSGSDNWPLMQTLFNGLEGRHDASSMYTYFDRSTQEIEYCFAQDFFKNDLYQINLLVREDVASKESLIDSPEVFNQKMNNGEYAIAYCPWQQPNNDDLKAAGKDYQYRWVYLNIPQDTSKFLTFETESVGNRDNFAIFKDSVSEEDLIQILRWYDYQLSDVCSKMLCWGPRDAGLFEESGGERKFVSQDLADAMVYQLGGGGTGLALKYNLTDGSDLMGMPTTAPLIALIQGNLSKYQPAYTYNTTEINPADAANKFQLSWWQPSDRSRYAKSLMWADVWNFGDIEKLKQANDSGVAINDALTRILTAESDAQFEQYYQDMLDIASYIGYTEEARVQATKFFRLRNYSFTTGVDFNDYLK